MAFRLMCVTAHPDDEAAAFGGALLMAAAEGVETSVICLTEGAAGSYRSAGQTDAELACARRAEFVAACASLRVGYSFLHTYPDGGLHREPFQPLVGVLVGHMRRLKPHVVLTFGADGGVNLHRDHTVVSLAATAAFHWSGRSGFYPQQLNQEASDRATGAAALMADGAAPQRFRPWAPQKLYYAATPFISTRDEEAAGAVARVPESLSLELGTWKHRKIGAFLEHGSQRGVLERVRAEFEDSFETEGYLLVAARTPAYPDQALFAGVVAE